MTAALSYPRIIVDTQKQKGQYKEAMLFTPNLPEAEQAVGYAITSVSLPAVDNLCPRSTRTRSQICDKFHILHKRLNSSSLLKAKTC
jgi:hypothetical protein